jgi:hypothetical protein
MRRIALCRPSPALVISIISLVIAVGGVSYAATKVGTDSLRNGAVTSEKVRNNSLRGVDILESSLGTVPSAGKAIIAGKATTFGGDPPSAFQPRLDWARVSVSGFTATIQHGNNATAAGRIANGRYFVTFSHDVRGCAYFPSAWGVNAAAGDMNADEYGPTDAKSVEVQSWGTNGLGDLPDGKGFYLLVVC